MSIATDLVLKYDQPAPSCFPLRQKNCIMHTHPSPERIRRILNDGSNFSAIVRVRAQLAVDIAEFNEEASLASEIEEEFAENLPEPTGYWKSKICQELESDRILCSLIDAKLHKPSMYST